MPLRNIPRRRAVRTALVLPVLPAAAALIGGCSDPQGRRSGAPGPSSPSPDPAEILRERAARDSAALLVRYDATIAAHPGLAARLRPLRAEVARHVAAFGPATGRGPAPSPSATASASASASASAAPSPSVSVPSGKSPALAALAGAERTLAGERAAALLDAPPELARLLASVAACGAGHVLLLKEN
ncbi:hypothetical protein ACFWVC_36565 [Streptomyces sp. NPDC058691]|uniref:hypothetical protein n=1 Tax=Streptomyces sp. NPDC058691 TaxID=3346601 RepID=UPI003663A51B